MFLFHRQEQLFQLTGRPHATDQSSPFGSTQRESTTKKSQNNFQEELFGHEEDLRICPLVPLGLLPLGLRVLDGFRSLCRMKECGDGFDGELFPRLFISWRRKLQLSPFTHCPLVSHCQQSPRILCTRCFVH